MIGVELVEPGTTTPSPAGRRARCSRRREPAASWSGKGGLYGNVLRIAPPLSVDRQQAEEALAVLADAFLVVDGSWSGSAVPEPPRQVTRVFRLK